MFCSSHIRFDYLESSKEMYMKIVLTLCLPPLLLLTVLLAWQPALFAAPTAPGAVLYRVNTGGPQLPAADGSLPDWSADTNAAPSPYVTFPTDQGKIYTTTQVISLDPSVPPSAPMQLFQDERFDQPPGGPFPLATEMRWAFPVTTGLTVQVRLYLAEIYHNGPGLRLFDVEIDGVVPPVFDNLDVFTLTGSKYKGMMLSYLVVSDGVVNIDFRHVGTDNPSIKALEIVEGGGSLPTVAQPVADFQVLQDALPTPLDLAGVFTDVEDGSNLTLVVSDNSNPVLVTPNLTGNTLTLSYAAGQHGTATITVRATDTNGGAVNDSFAVTINGKPALAPVAAQTLNEGAPLNLTITATDPENDDLALTATGLPNGATFVDHNDKSGLVSWIPDFDATGSYSVTVTVADSHGQATSQVIAITVLNTNRPPTASTTGKQQVKEGETINVTVTASDPDADPLTLTATGLPTGAIFTDNKNGTATLVWATKVGDAGDYTVPITVKDALNATITQQITLKVDGNPGGADTNRKLFLPLVQR